MVGLRALSRGGFPPSVDRVGPGDPGRRAADLAEEAGVDKAWFKQNVRKLKALGLTESLEVGYRLSPRGRAYWKRAH